MNLNEYLKELLDVDIDTFTTEPSFIFSLEPYMDQDDEASWLELK